MDEQIPKILHYCWFSGEPLSDLANRCIESWRKYCPDYEIVEWNATNFDIHSNSFAKQAYDKRKWAFLTDYARLNILYTHGGIYMDTDVELVKSYDEMLVHSAFSGYETTSLQTAVMGAAPNHPWMKYLLSYYDNRNFVKKNGELDTLANPIIVTKMTETMYGSLSGKEQHLGDGLVLYPSDWFSPKNHVTGIISSTKNTIAIHHFEGSWHPERNQKLYQNTQKFIHNSKVIECLTQTKTGTSIVNIVFSSFISLICYGFFHTFKIATYFVLLRLKRIIHV